jgi:hypothetical protein
MTELLIRLLVGLVIAMVAGVVRLLLGVVRLVLWLFALAGFRGARLLGLAATVAGVCWAAATVGVGPAVRLALIGWAAWAVRHHREAIRRSAAVRRVTFALDRYAAELGAAAKRLQPPRPRPTTTRPGSTPTPAPPPGGTPGIPPPLAFEPSRLETVARYVAGRWGTRPRSATPAPHTALVDGRQP